MESPRGAGGKRGLAFCEGYNKLSSEFHGLCNGLCCFLDGDFIFFSHCGEGKDRVPSPVPEAVPSGRGDFWGAARAYLTK